VFVRKKQIMARLLGIQKALALRPNTFLLNLQNQLTKEYNLILQMKEEIWAMKAMMDWIHDIDEVKNMFLSSYKQLYQTEQCFCPINP